MIHPTALVDRAARLGSGVRIGPFASSVPMPNSPMRSISCLMSSSPGTRASEPALVSIPSPRSVTRRRTASSVVNRPSIAIGTDCVLREGVTVHPGTAAGRLETEIGDRCLLMANAHVAHDCRIGSDVTLANNVMLAGHVDIGDHASLGGGVGVHQHVRIGELAFVGGLSGLEGDLIPFGLAVRKPRAARWLNLIGLRRSGVPRDTHRRARRDGDDAVRTGRDLGGTDRAHG